MIPKGSLREPLSVGGLTNIIKALLEAALFNIWVEGELTEVSQHRSGHVYLTLKDQHARVEAVVWRTTEQRMRYKPGPGERVVAFGRMQVYGPQGKYQLVIERLEPAGQGARKAALEALIQKLQAEGVFDRPKLPLPYLPTAVGVVTSGSGAARRDIEAVIARRAPQIPIVLYPAAVQGPQAEAEIVAGLRALNARPDVAVIIVGRGGGSSEDLWAFNTEAVARAIVACTVPVISAVGHQTDVSLADRVADLRAATPSEAAEKAVPVRDDLLAYLAEISGRMQGALRRTLARAEAQRSGLSVRLVRALALDGRRLEVQRLRGRLERAHPRQRATQAQAKLKDLRARLEVAVDRRLREHRAALQLNQTRLEALSPLAVLARGYSITTYNGQVVRDPESIPMDARVAIRVQAGEFLADRSGGQQ